MRSSAIVLALSALVVSSAAAEPKLECVISASRTKYEVGEIPDLSCRILNQTGGDVVLVGSLDGSSDGMRFPRCEIEIMDAAGKPVIARYGRCGNMNPLRLEDFVVVPTGQTFDPFSEGFFKPYALYQFPVTTPGDYTVRFRYSTSDRVQDYFGDERRGGLESAPFEIQRLFERVPKVDLVSKELVITFFPKSEQ